MHHEHLTVDRAGHCATVRLHQPVGAGALARATVDELHDALSELEDDDGLRALLLVYQGAADDAADPPSSAAAATASAELVERLGRITPPVIAAIAGDALGLALEIGLACDVRIGTPGAVFGLPRIRAGVMPFAGGTQRLPRLIGQGRALDMVLTGDPIGVQEAQRVGLIQRIVEASDLVAEATALATAMALAAPMSMRLTKEALHQGLDMTLDQGLKMELDLYLLLFTTQDRVEGITAFKQKRKPRFSGS